MFVVRRLQELGRKEGVPIYTCFVDLQKAHDSVDRSLLWVVLAPILFNIFLTAVLNTAEEILRVDPRLKPIS